MATNTLVISFFSVLTAGVVVLPLEKPTSDLATSPDCPVPGALAVVTADKDQEVIQVFDYETTRRGGKPDRTLKPRLETDEHRCPSIDGLTGLYDETLGCGLAVGTCPSRSCGDIGCPASAVEIYDGEAVMVSGGAALRTLSGSGVIDVMTQLKNASGSGFGGFLVAQSSIFLREAYLQGGNATTVLDTKYALLDAVTPFQGGVAYTSSNANSLLVFDDVAIASGGDPDAALEWGGDTRGPADLHPAKWRIPEHICAGPSHVFADGAIAVFGTCELTFEKYEESSEMLLLEDVDLKAQTLKNRSFTMMKGSPRAVSAFTLYDGNGQTSYVAVGVTTISCGEGHVEIFEESALRSGGKPTLVVNASGSVNSMVVYGDRLAVSTTVGGFSGGHCGTSGTVDIIDVAEEMRQRSSISV